MTNPVAAVEAEPTPGEQLLSLFEQQWEALLSMELAANFMDSFNPASRLRILAEQHDVAGLRDIRGLEADQRADIGEHALKSFFKHEEAELVYTHAVERKAAVDEELLVLAKGLVGSIIHATPYDGSPAVRRERYSWSGEPRSQALMEGRGVMTKNPVNYVGDGRLELTPVGLRPWLIGGTYHIDPIDGEGNRRVVLEVED